ncbi:MAG: hypothetical protein LLG13_13495 [Bacteroidales bacterium]|nr:hypothetical protein [Bacteroidales bacterium]
MKKFMITSILIALVTTGTTLLAQNEQVEYLGLPGDNLNLYAVMKLFQESETLEGFERRLNERDSRINNLDLNGDNMVDYIMVSDNIYGDVHNIVLQVAVNAREIQDVAVFTVQRFSNGQVQIQLTGDEELYGRNYIIEPIFDDSRNETANPGYLGNNVEVNGQRVVVTRTSMIEIAAWPVVRFIFLPDYRYWHSSWRWGYYPPYWNPWQPYYWHYYYGYHHNWYPHYYSHYRHWNQHRYSHWNDYYYVGRHSHSPFVSAGIRNGRYKDTYSRPEMRKAGEAMYARTQQNQDGRRYSAGNNSGRRSGSQASMGNRSIGTYPYATSTRRSSSTMTGRSSTNPSAGQNAGTTTRRSSSTVTTRPATSPSAGQSTSTTRRSTSTVTTRPATSPSAGQSTSTTRRSSSTVTTRSATSPSAGQSTSTTRRSSSTVTTRPASNPSARQSTGTTRPSGRPSTTNASSSSRRSSGSSNSGTTINENKRNESSGSSQTTRRAR